MRAALRPFPPDNVDVATQHTGPPTWSPKLEGLRQLRALKDRSFVVDPFCYFAVSELESGLNAAIELVLTLGLGPRLAVRSAAWQEDLLEREPAGYFSSVLNVDGSDRDAIRSAIDCVLSSYQRGGRSPTAEKTDYVIVQHFVPEVALTGIARYPASSQLYIEVDYDDTSGQTDTITAGRAAKRASIFRDAAELPKPWRSIRAAAEEINALLSGSPFLIEFAIDQGGNVHVFQVRIDRRPGIATDGSREQIERRSLEVELAEVATSLLETGPLSIMADWNPAEMLGRHPRPLSISLYKSLVTDRAWAVGRAQVGWHMPADPELMTLILGRPFVKLRTSLESLLPASLPKELADRVVADRMEYLRSNPALHDKVEFQVMWSGYDFGLNERLSGLVQRNFTRSEILTIRASLKELSQHALQKFPSWHEADLAAQDRVAAARTELSARLSQSRMTADITSALLQAMNVCRDSGVIPFARQARLAFMCRDMLAVLAKAGALSETWLDAWIASIFTVASEVPDAFHQVQTGSMSRSAFDQRFGHLRPHSYNVQSRRYDEMKELPVGTTAMPTAISVVPILTASDIDRLNRLFEKLGGKYQFNYFLDVAAKAIQARELIKFTFSGLLSDIVRGLQLLGRRCALSDDDLSFLTYEAISELSRPKLAKQLSEASALARSAWERGSLFVTPDIAFTFDDFSVVRPISAIPTFVGARTAQGRVHVLKESSFPSRASALWGKIVLIPAADPGFDWIFSCSIGGLVTQDGGEFSHMAVRCAHFGLPAAIGCGESIFRRAKAASVLLIDPAIGLIEADGKALYRAGET